MTDSPALDVLLPLDRAGQRLEPREDEAGLMALFDSPARLVRANMIATLDGGGTGPDGVTASINGPADLRVFRVLRAQAEVVLVGAGTARDEGYRALGVPAGTADERARRGLPPQIELAIVTVSGELPDALLDADRPPYVVTAADAPALDALRARVGEDRVLAHGTGGIVDLAAGLAALAERGLGRVLAEGGPGLLAQLVAQDLVDELCLTWSPLLVGGPAPRILRSGAWLDPIRRLTPLHLLHADGVLLGRWRAR